MSPEDAVPFTTLGRAGENDLRRQRRLMALLREATGIDDVKPERRRQAGATVMLDKAISTKSTQRVSLQQDTRALMLCTWPAELKPQAIALYRRTGRAQRLMDFVAEHSGTWQARPNVHLAFWNAPVALRLYLSCHLEITEYVHRWSGTDLDQVGAHCYDDIRENLWPWLRERQYAGPEDDQQLDAFLKHLHLGRRDAHLRPGIKVERTWPWPHAVDLDERGALASEVRTAVAELLTALDEPLPPACTEERLIAT
jgi:O-acetyl-ADP-ribose deacetylase